MVRIFKILIIVSAIALITSISLAELTFEANYDKGAGLSVGDPNTGILQGSSNIVSDRLNVPMNSSGGCLYTASADTFFDVSIDGTSWGQNTVMGIFNLDVFPWGIRQTLFTVAFESAEIYYPGWKGLIIWVNNSAQRPQVQLIGNAWGDPDGIATLDLDYIFPPVLETGVDYYIAVSWSDLSLSDDLVEITMYLRKVNDTSGVEAIYAKVTDQSAGATDWDLQNVLVGQRGNEGIEELGGDIDLLRVFAGAYLGSAGEHELLFNSTVSGAPADCQAAILDGYKIDSDINGDCEVDLEDTAMLAASWFACNDPENVNCQ